MLFKLIQVCVIFKLYKFQNILMQLKNIKEPLIYIRMKKSWIKMLLEIYILELVGIMQEVDKILIRQLII